MAITGFSLGGRSARAERKGLGLRGRLLEFQDRDVPRDVERTEAFHADLGPVAELNLRLAGAGDDVPVGHDKTLVVDQEAAAEADLLSRSVLNADQDDALTGAPIIVASVRLGSALSALLLLERTPLRRVRARP